MAINGTRGLSCVYAAYSVFRAGLCLGLLFVVLFVHQEPTLAAPMAASPYYFHKGTASGYWGLRCRGQIEHEEVVGKSIVYLFRSWSSKLTAWVETASLRNRFEIMGALLYSTHWLLNVCLDGGSSRIGKGGPMLCVARLRELTDEPIDTIAGWRAWGDTYENMLCVDLIGERLFVAPASPCNWLSRGPLTSLPTIP